MEEARKFDAKLMKECEKKVGGGGGGGGEGKKRTFMQVFSST